VSGVA